MSEKDANPGLYPEDSVERMAYFLWLGFKPEKAEVKTDDQGFKRIRLWYKKKDIAIALADYKTSDFNRMAQSVVQARFAIRLEGEDAIREAMSEYRPKYDY